MVPICCNWVSLSLSLSRLKRDLATGFGVLFARMGGLRRRAGAMSTGIIILFAAIGGLLSWGIRNDQCSRARVC